jgi:hypothetical protein
MMYDLDIAKWIALAEEFWTGFSSGETYDRLDEDGRAAYERIEELYGLFMDETGEEHTQEWRENLTREEAAAVAVFDREIDGIVVRMRLLELHENAFGLPEW